MNAACSIVANKKMGAVPFLIGNNGTGLMYDGYQDLERKVKKLINNKKLREQMSLSAYQYITTKWTGSIAAENIIKLFDDIINEREVEIKDGPASRCS